MHISLPDPRPAAHLFGIVALLGLSQPFASCLRACTSQLMLLELSIELCFAERIIDAADACTLHRCLRLGRAIASLGALRPRPFTWFDSFIFYFDVVCTCQ